jgi:arginine-tRNA-protein transferase
MFAQVHCPEILAPEELDQYLEQGWFRMGQTIFTTNFLNFKSNFYSAVWLRISLRDFGNDNTQQKLLKKNSRFRVEIKRASITPAQEALFARYKQHISFDASASLHTLLFGKSNTNLYNTQEINLYDNDKLVAAGFFDLGKTSAAGISSFYDPDYKKFSLGKHLIYLKIAYCKQLGFQFFYPGYFVPGYPLFDYKLEIGKRVLQYLEFTSDQWKAISQFSQGTTPLQQMSDKLRILQHLLTKIGIESKILKYEFFDANLIPELEGIVLFDFPIFLSCVGLSEETLIVFSVKEQLYHWVKCKSVWASTSASNPEIYSSHVFKFDYNIFSSEMPELISSAIVNELKSEGKVLRANSM